MIKTNVIKVSSGDMTAVQYFDDIKTNKEYNFISGTFIINCKLHCIKLEEINWHFRTVWHFLKTYRLKYKVSLKVFILRNTVEWLSC